MIQRIKINLDAVESLLYFWQATADKEKVNERFINDVSDMEGYKYIYDDEFIKESLRKILSAVTNKEIFTSQNRKEGRFWNNNLWMLEDLGYTDMMVSPLKHLNLENLATDLKELNTEKSYEEIEVIFVPAHLEDYYVVDNKLIVNFFRLRPEDGDLFINEKGLVDFIEEKIRTEIL
jgi:hypothetical protein